MRWRQSLFILGVYAVLAVGMTWPIAGQLGSHIPGSEGDAWVHLWTFRWVRDALLAGQNPFYTPRLFFPHGVSLLFHNIAWLHIAAWLPLQTLWHSLPGEAAAYSLVFLAIFALNGWATFLLAREIVPSEAAAFVAGLVAAFWPYTLSHHNHPNLIFFAFVPLAMLHLRRALSQEHIRPALLAGLYIGLAGVSRWQVLIVASPLLFLWVGKSFCHELPEFSRIFFRGDWWPKIKVLFVSGGVALGVMLPLAGPVVVAQLQRSQSEELFVAESLNQADLLAYVLPSRYHPLWGEAVLGLYEPLGASKTFVPFVGYTTLLLALIGLVAGWRQRHFGSRMLGLMVLVYLLLALGPTLEINGRSTLTLPYSWLQDFFLLRLVRHPDRFNILLAIPMALLAAWGLAALPQRSQWAGTVTALCSLLILAEYAVTYPTLALHTPAWYSQLAQEPGPFGIADIPLNDRSYDKEYMFYQLTHGQGLVEGHVSRPPAAAYQFIDSVPLLALLRQNREGVPDLPDVAQQLALLAAADVRYLVLHDKFLSAEAEAVWRAWLLVPPAYEDDELVVYSTKPPQLGRDFALVQVLTRTAEGAPEIGLVAAMITPTTAVAGSLIDVQAHWGSATAPARPYTLCLQLAAPAGDTVSQQCESLAAGWSTIYWQANELVQTRHRFVADPFWVGGTYGITAVLQTAAGEPLGKPAVLGQLTYRPLPRQFAPPQPSVLTDIAWDNGIDLVGYDLAQSPMALDLTFYWRPQQRLPHSYKLFVHLLDAQGGLAAQADLVPRNWGYPTNWWEAGEYVVDSVPLSLASVAGGDYELLVGWYDPDTGERVGATAVGYPIRQNAVSLLVPLTITTPN